ncbi:class E vacuolar protein-sorting machinery protein hse1 [Histoplasma ohiense]|nr:class E vacuolar protein-sorting machinery protein hse1 [Histoplasma ohiense (nom. inval.)]
MFRTQQNAFDDAVAKATDENLTSENWEFILDVCDKVGGEDTGAKDAVAALIKRIAHRNANVQLYTLELANALSQNCGVKMHRELASRSFTDSLLRLANDRNTHQQVKAKILERMEEWTEMFSSNPDFGLMEQAYMKLKSQNPNLQPPSKPTKRQITDFDRQKEEEELQMALALSIKDKPSTTQSTTTAQSTSSQENQSALAAPHPVPSGTTAATVSRVRALYDFQPSEPGELQFRKGDVIAVLESVYKDWWKGSLRGQTGIFPLNYVEKLSDPTQEELQREAQMESEVFAEIKNVEKLLTLLSTSSSELNVQDNDEITTLYHSTLAIRPKLIELIGKYSQKKDDFTQLNEKFIKARRDYESLLDASMAHPAQPYYGRLQKTTYGYPLQNTSVGYPQGPPQDDPQRYYAARPQEGQKPFQAAQTLLYSSEQVPLPYPNNGQTSDTGQRTPSGSQHLPQPQQQLPSDEYGANSIVQNHSEGVSDYPQELATSVYEPPQDTVPLNNRHSYHSPGYQTQSSVSQHKPQSQQPPDFSSASYSPVGLSTPQTQSANPPYPSQSLPLQHRQQQQNFSTSTPPQPNKAPPPGLPSGTPGQPPYPIVPASVRPGPASEGYQPHHTIGGTQAASSNVNTNPSSFYR